MKPYLAIIKDSFGEAVSTKILWVILVLCLGFLAVLLPFSVTEFFPTQYNMEEARAALGVAEALQDPTTDAQRHVAEIALKKTELKTLDAKKDHERVWSTLKMLNALLAAPELHDPVSMKGLDDSEIARILGKGVGSLESDELAQLNRRILAELFPKFLPLPEGFRCDISYAGKPLSTVTLSKKMVLDAGILGFATYGVSFFGVLLPLLFTAGMVPRAFEPGSVEMTLSKPIRRSFVFIAKFLGGCSFAFIMAGVIALGIFLIAGFRLDYWQWRLLLCIPIFVFNFSVYYTISALVGLTMRNTTMALFCGLAFLLVCFGVGKTKQWSDELAFMPNLPTHVEVIDDEVLVSTAGGVLQRWNTVANTWEGSGDFLGMTAVQAKGIRFVGPVYDPKNDRALRIDSMSTNVLVASMENEFVEKQGPALPARVIDVKRHPDGTVYLIAGHGLSRFSNEDGKTEAIVQCSPTLRCGVLAYAAMHPANGDVAICGNNRLVVLSRKDDGSYAVTREASDMQQRHLVIGFLGTSIVGVDDDGVAHVYDDDLKEIESLTPVRNEVPRSMETSKDGKTLYMLYHNQELWAMDTAEPGRAKKAKVSDQGAITAATVQRDGTLAIGHGLNRVTIYDSSLKPMKTYRPKMTRFESVYRFGIVPLYTLFPKPTEISNFTAYVITGKLSHQHGRDASVFRPRINVWQPIWSCAIFVVVVMGLGCAWVNRRDF